MTEIEDFSERSGPLAPNPADVRDLADHGDATVRNFRYQHAYGVMLLVAAKRGKRPYVALWCEHHEDFLAERTDGRYDGYQIKTSRQELGPWTLTDAKLVATIGRFVGLVGEFAHRIANVFFVSNTECDHVTDQSTNQRKRGNCPKLFLEHIKKCNSTTEIQPPFLDTFNSLQAQCGCDADDLFSVILRMDIIQGPSRSEFDATLSHEHIAKLNDCQTLSADKLDSFKDEMVAKVYRASSLQVNDPIRHLRATSSNEQDPVLLAKRLVVDDIVNYRTTHHPTFQFQGSPTLKLGSSRSPSILVQKLKKGGLAGEVDYMLERERAAEYNLMEDVTRRPDQYPRLLRQVEQLVLGECSEANLRARQGEEPYGPAMLIDVQDRLRKIARENPNSIGHLSYECLVGVAGLLTSECRVWWSPRFPVIDEAGS